jgi:hypothetical protein
VNAAVYESASRDSALQSHKGLRYSRYLAGNSLGIVVDVGRFESRHDKGKLADESVWIRIQ